MDYFAGVGIVVRGRISGGSAGTYRSSTARTEKCLDARERVYSLLCIL